jgi:hypothetical protein
MTQEIEAQGIEKVVKMADMLLKLRPILRVQVRKGDMIKSHYSSGENQVERIYSFPDTILNSISDYVLTEPGEVLKEAEIVQQGVQWLVFSLMHKGYYGIGAISASDLRNIGPIELSAKHSLSKEVKQKLYDDFYRNRKNTTVGDDNVILYRNLKEHSLKK